MSDVDVSVARERMGRALGDWIVSSEMSHEVSPGLWYFFSGLPVADVNMAMIYNDDMNVLTKTLNEIVRMNVPTCLFLAAYGKNLSDRLADEWSHVGVLPLMTKVLDNDVQDFDPRVSLVTIDDIDAAVALMAESFLHDPVNFAFLVEAFNSPDSLSKIWLLKEDGVAVSTVTTILVDDALTVWCMATPPQYARKGYGKALLRDVLNRSANTGAKTGLLGATPAGQPLYKASGWEVLEEWDLYLNSPANH
ncbi:MAG: GNAT family N-acetyltransferase [Actinomycetota bacterium]